MSSRRVKRNRSRCEWLFADRKRSARRSASVLGRIVLRRNGRRLAVLAVATMTISAVGLYGLIAYGVAQRTREIGIRIALGARARDLLTRVAGGALRLMALGIVVGVIGESTQRWRSATDARNVMAPAMSR
ncbi:MAG TPA: FtsX-like permease family protein [Gemmatimonadaceae bacterium]